MVCIIVHIIQGKFVSAVMSIILLNIFPDKPRMEPVVIFLKKMWLLTQANLKQKKVTPKGDIIALFWN